MSPLQDVLSDHRSRAEKDNRRPYAAFNGAIVPERNLLTRELLSGFAAQFWGQTITSAQSLDGLAAEPAGQPAPLPLAAPSGLSRTQFLVACQAVAPPCIPNYCAAHGGLVLDRVLFKAGGDGWWTALTGRAKIRNLLAAYQDKQLVQQLKNPGNYLLCSSSKVSLGSNTTLRIKGEVDGKGARTNSRTAGDSAEEGGAAVNAATSPLTSASVQLRHKLRGAEARAELGLNSRMLKSGGASPGLTTVPVNLTLDLGTPASSASALQYRVGLHHVTTQGTEQAAEAAAVSDERGPLRHAMHLQSAVAMHGEHTLWSHKPRPTAAAASPTKASAAAAGARGATAQLGAAPLQLSTPTAHSSGTAAAPGTSGAAMGPKPPTKTIGPHNPLRKSLGKVLSSLTGGGSGPGAAGGDEPGDKGASKWPRLGLGSGASGEAAPLLDPDQIHEALLDSTQSISRLREDVQGITSWVSTGNLTRSLSEKGLTGAGKRQKGWGGGGGADRGKHAQGTAALAARGPRNAALAPPHFKVGGLLGLAGRVPVIHHRPGNPQGQADAAAQKDNQQQQQQQGEQSDHALTGGRGDSWEVGRVSMQHVVSRSVSWLQQQVRGTFTQQGPALWPFASGAAELQLGSMQRNFLDFTRVLVKADMGLRSTDEHKSACMLAGGGQQACGLWQALTVSVSQQLVGPVRVCADWRFAVEPGRGSQAALDPASDQSLAAGLRRLPAQVRGARACLIDSVVALDVALPKTSGLARLVAWYAPGRREGMVEVRMF